MRVLVVEDELDLADAIARGLRREGYAVDLAHGGDEALEKARVYPYDLICLDLNLPGTGGSEVCRTLRAEERRDGAPQPRILMLTALGGVSDRIAGLDDGADDYLVKPFELAELARACRALLRRNGDGRPALLQVGDLELDPARHEASRGGTPLALTPKEFALLRYLMSRPGEALSEFDLLTHVWDENANPLTRTVRVTVMTLRRKLAAAGGEQPIETVAGSRLPVAGGCVKEFLRSIRVRLTLLYSGVLFAVAALVIASLYLGLSLSLRDEPLSQAAIRAQVPVNDGSRTEERTFVEARSFERQVNARTLHNLRRFSLAALGGPVRREPRRSGGWSPGACSRRSRASRDGGARDPGGGAVAPDRSRWAGRRAEAAGRHLRLDARAARRRVRVAAPFRRRRLARAAHAARDHPDEPRARPDRGRRNGREPCGRGGCDQARDRPHGAADGRPARARAARRAGRAARAGRARRRARGCGRGVRRGGRGAGGGAGGRRRPGVAVASDRDVLKRAVANLLDNAVRVAPEGSRIRLSHGELDGWAWLAVADEGPGISQEHQQRIFDRFWRVDPSRARPAGGSGLGLAIVRQLAEAHGGSVEVFSEPGRGATFVLWLPLSVDAAPAAPSVDPTSLEPALL